MNVRQLHDQLAELIAGGHAETEIKFAYNYGDHWRTTVAADIDTISEVRVKYSDYHSMDKVLDDVSYDDEPSGDRTILILE